MGPDSGPVTDSESDPKSRRWFITALVAGGIVLVKLGRRVIDDIAEGAGRIGGLFELWREIRPSWFVKARWSFKAFYFYTLIVYENIQKQLDIPAGEFGTIALDTNKRSQLIYDMSVPTGPKIDALLFTDEEYDKYIQKESANYISAASNLATRDCNEEFRFAPVDNYLLVLDNSERGRANPEGREASLELLVQLEAV